jgi:hypothetical protein
MAKRPKRQKAIKRLNLSDHSLNINIRRCNYNKFNFSDIEDYVREMVGSRDYQTPHEIIYGAIHGALAI